MHFRKIHALLFIPKNFHSVRSTSLPEGWELVVGLEVHVQLMTATKLFSRAPTSFNVPPNQNVAHMDAAFPGTLPVCSFFIKIFGKAFGIAIVIHGMYFFYSLPSI